MTNDTGDECEPTATTAEQQVRQAETQARAFAAADQASDHQAFVDAIPVEWD